jgi:hypothetical protein
VAALTAAVALVAVAVTDSGDGDPEPGAAGPTASAPVTARTTPEAEPSPSPSSASPEPAGRTASEPVPVVGEWRGSYYCNQGQTGLTLTVSGTADDLVATFAFYPVPGNPEVPRGSFAMAGSYVGTRLELFGDHWIEQPDDYLMVGLLAEVTDRSPGIITGTVTSESPTGCSTFTVARS